MKERKKERKKEILQEKYDFEIMKIRKKKEKKKF